jgi:hypothetical protein
VAKEGMKVQEVNLKFVYITSHLVVEILINILHVYDLMRQVAESC